MMTDSPSLLPNNATDLERALEQVGARIAAVPVTVKELWNPWTCPLDLLPWLAWALSADHWDPNWTEAQKRQTVADAIAVQRIKGTPASLDKVLAYFDPYLTLTEWHQEQPRGDPYTFKVNLPIVTPDGQIGGLRTSAAFVEAIIRDVVRTKPARAHFDLVQSLDTAAAIDLVAAGRVAGFVRLDGAAVTTIDPVWSTYLTNNVGEPFEDGAGGFLIAA